MGNELKYAGCDKGLCTEEDFMGFWSTGRVVCETLLNNFSNGDWKAFR